MYFSEGEFEYQKEVTSAACAAETGREVVLEGYVQAIRKLGGLAFISLRDRGAFVQLNLEGGNLVLPKEGSCIRVKGLCRKEERAPRGIEIKVSELEILVEPRREFPAALGKRNLPLALETDLENRPFSLRHSTHLQRFKIQAGLAEGFRSGLRKAGFQEIFTPKLVAGCAEGGANMFRVPYFGQTAFLAQSPQLYKQIMVGVYGRVFEVGHVYRAEQHSTSRHLNEYVSLDMEMGFIRNLEDLMQVQTAIIKSMFTCVKKNQGEAIAELGMKVPEIGRIPVLHLNEAKEMIKEAELGAHEETGSLSAREERVLCQAVLEKYGEELVFVTNYHVDARPFYAAEVGENSPETKSFDLLFRGTEITTGGVRIHEPELLKEKMLRFGLKLEPFKHYLSAFEYGLPPHGGSGTGLERVSQLLCEESNIRQGALFPRDLTRLEP